MPIIDKINAVRDPQFVDRLAASRGGPDIAVPATLLRLMASCDITKPADVDRLDENQLARLLENKTP